MIHGGLFWHSHDSEGLTVSRYDVSVVQGFDLGPGSPSVRFLVLSLGKPIGQPDKSPVVNGEINGEQKALKPMILMQKYAYGFKCRYHEP